MTTQYSFEEVSFRGIPAMFTSLRVKQADIPSGMYRYELREEAGEICQLSTFILVAHFGTLLTSQPIQLPVLTCLDCSSKDLVWEAGGCRFLQDFLNKHPHVPDDTMKWFKPNPEEIDLFYSQGEKADVSSGCIGHLRGDFYHSEVLHTSWWPHYWDKSCNDTQFKADLTRVMGWLQSDFAPLQSMVSIQRFCRRQEEFALPDQTRGACGLCVETAHYRYMLRCTPQVGDYNVYLHCYSKEAATPPSERC